MCDIVLDYRKFEVTAKFGLFSAGNAIAGEPGTTTFNSQKNIVDFSRFLKAPEAAYGNS